MKSSACPNSGKQAWLNASQRSRIGVGMNKSARVKRKALDRGGWGGGVETGGVAAVNGMFDEDWKKSTTGIGGSFTPDFMDKEEKHRIFRDITRELDANCTKMTISTT